MAGAFRVGRISIVSKGESLWCSRLLSVYQRAWIQPAPDSPTPAIESATLISRFLLRCGQQEGERNGRDPHYGEM